MNENEISNKVIGLCIQIHTQYGPGLLESVYEKLLLFELKKAGFEAKFQVPIKLIHEDIDLGIAFKADIIVNEKVILELKSVKNLENVHYKQLLSYLKISELKLGLLINFNEVLLKNGIKRVINNL